MKKSSLVVLLCLLCSQITFAKDIHRFLNWNGKPLPQERTGVEKLAYIAPNEYWAHLFLPAPCKTNSVLLAVGSLRGLTDVSDGKCAMLIQFDYDFGMKSFNLVNLQLIDLAKDRFEYLAMLILGVKTHPAIEQARNGTLNILQMLDAILAEVPLPHDYVGAWQQMGVEYEGPDAVRVLSKNNGVDLKNAIRTMFQFEFHAMSGVGSLKHTFFGNDAGFANVQSMVRSGRIKVVQGNVFNKTVLEPLGIQITENKMTVAGFDISNIAGYLLSPGAGPAPTIVGRYENVMQNILLLPASDDFQLLFTAYPSLARNSKYDVERSYFGVPFIPTPWGYMTWHYYTVPKSKFAALRQIYEDTENGTAPYNESFRFQALLFKNIPLSPLDPGNQMLYSW